jgi:hypothetical protein
MITLKKQYEANWRLEDIFTEIKDIKAWLKIEQYTEKISKSRDFISSFELNGKNHSIILNTENQKVYDEEKLIRDEIQLLVNRYWAIKNIPLEVVKERWYIWYHYGKQKKYKILKELSDGKWLVEYK